MVNGLEGKGRNQGNPASTALRVRSSGQVAGGARGGGENWMDWRVFGRRMDPLAARLEVRGEGNGGTEDDS